MAESSRHEIPAFAGMTHNVGAGRGCAVSYRFVSARKMKE